MPKNIVIMGAAGRDFHVFNTCYRDNLNYKVVAFTSTQIPGISNRRYPEALAGRRYPCGIPIKDESELTSLIKDSNIDEVIFAYSDVSYKYVKQKEKLVKKAGADFRLFDIQKSMLKSTKPVIAVCAVRTGAGKSPTSRKIAEILKSKGKKPVVIRHPMPYGTEDLEKKVVQRFASLYDMEAHKCTIEEMEEYEPHINNGFIVYAGVDYREILKQAETEADVIVWDGGNNDTPFYKPDLHITLVDPLRAGDELKYFPGKINFELADVLLINKTDLASKRQIKKVKKNIKKYNSSAVIIEAKMPVTVSDESLIRNKKVLVVEDGPTLTHGNMKFGAGVVASQNYGAKKIIDPRPYIVGEIKKTFQAYPNIGALLPAMGYSPEQIKDLETTINQTPVDTVVIATPINLANLIKINKPFVRVTYNLEETTRPDLEDLLQKF